MKKTMTLIAVIFFSLFIATGCSSSLKEQLLESQNKNLQNDLDFANERLVELKMQLADQKAKGKTIAIRNRNVNNWNRVDIKNNQAEIAKIKKVNSELNKALFEEIKKGEISIAQRQSNLVIYAADKLFFASGSAELTDSGKISLNKIGEVLNWIPDRMVRIEGHTDNVPIGKELQSLFPTNWELSAVRAVNVLRYLSMDANIDANRMSVAAFGQFKPLVSNSSEAGRAKNRRIEILITDQDYNRYSLNQ
jgi:chemotaxis protein MotB